LPQGEPRKRGTIHVAPLNLHAPPRFDDVRIGVRRGCKKKLGLKNSTPPMAIIGHSYA
jgi:hypothetical protein